MPLRQAIDYTQYLADVNRHDAEDCTACGDETYENPGSGECLYHEGVSFGLRLACALVNRALEEPEAVAFAPGELERALGDQH